MSGQYPPPNPAHPYTRVPVPTQRVIPPWSHTPQPAPGLNMVGSSMNYFGSPHMGMRGSQSWDPPQTHPKPTETRPGANNPLYGLQMLMSADNATRIPTEYQQEETMDLSSHSNVSKITSTRPDNTTDVLRNGTILPVDVNINGEVVRTETEVGSGTEVKESIVTSVIAANPLRESVNVGDVNRSSPNVIEEEVKVEESIAVIKPEVEPCVTSGDTSVETSSEPVNSIVTSVLKTTSSIIPVLKSEPLDSCSTGDFVPNIVKPESLDKNKNCGFENTLKSDDNMQNIGTSQKFDESSVSFLDLSALSVDTDESKLVVAETSAEDIFGISPVDNPPSQVSEEVEKSKDSKEMVPSVIASVPATNSPEPSMLLAVTDKQPVAVTPAAPPVNNSEPQPSVENVETLLENMFNSQEENSCSSQTSSCGIPKSVIVSSGAKIPTESCRPSVDVISPMKEEDLASTLAEGFPSEAELKEVKQEEKVTDDVMDELEKKLEMLTESVASNISQLRSEAAGPLPDVVKKEPDDNKVASEGVVERVSSNETKISEEMLEEKLTKQPETQLPSQKAEVSSSCNPFIEVESELEKMFAGIVEPAEEAGGDNQSQPSVSDPKKPDVSKRTVSKKRKRANNRRPSDSSVFGGGSSSESTPVKKRGRKRVSDTGNERGAKKIKFDSGEPLKKKKLPKDFSNENLSGKVKGPFVHIEGPKDSPSSVVVVNSGVRLDDEDGLDKTSARRKHSTVHRSEGATARKAYSASTLSARYNSDMPDLSWVCALCHRGPHCEGGLGGLPAGDLFGPYRVPGVPPSDDSLASGIPSDREIAEEQKRRGGKYPRSLRTSGGVEGFIQKVGKKSKRSQSMDSVESPGLLPVEGSYEVWLHGPCAEWAPGLCIVGTTLVGLEDAVWTAIKTKCSQCGESGAGISCVMRSCPSRVHYPCALLTGWLLDPETFIARCHTHRTRLRPL